MSMVYMVYKNGHPTGIIESNYGYALRYWSNRARRAGKNRYHLVGYSTTDPDTTFTVKLSSNHNVTK